MSHVGHQNNAWGTDTAAEATSAGGFSRILDSVDHPFITAFGNCDAATTITVQVAESKSSPDAPGAWRDSQVNQVLAGAGDFCLHLTAGARYIRLKSSAAVNAQATISGKR